MKHLYLKRTVFVMLYLLTSMSGWAYSSFIVNGIAYHVLTGNTVAVAKYGEVSPQIISPVEYSGEVVIPSTVMYGGIQYTVVSILENIFKNNTSLTAITIPASVQEIGKQAFWNAGLKSLTISDGDRPLTFEYENYQNHNDSPFGGCQIDTLYWGRDIEHANRPTSSFGYSPFSTSLKDVTIGDL